MKDLNSKLSSDLANHGNPISSMFEQPKYAKNWEQYMLTEELPAIMQNKLPDSRFFPFLFDGDKELEALEGICQKLILKNYMMIL